MKTGCKYCDEGSAKVRLRHCYVHYLNYRCVPCSNEDLLTNLVRDSGKASFHMVGIDIRFDIT